MKRQKLAGKLFLLLCLFAGMVACSNDMQVIQRIVNPDEEPDLTAFQVKMDYSDSAILQMHLETPLIKQFTGEKNPRDSFPNGLHVWMYEKNGTLNAEIRANWALHDNTKKLWEARNNVVITRSNGESLESEQMFWDEAKGIVYSTKVTKYTSETGTTTTGRNGMWAKQDFSEWKMFNGNGTLVFNDEVTAP
ncbi:MAG: LPS export ABC transporter periplasmic protein LptC [Bacteroidales bacterium]|jgi:LPS export ABC transporter protein LptC|nr:LPS export ABC transporter periplasmic protein LptC [Bacteroidales bacterium]